MFKPQRIRDPLHDLIGFRANEFENTLWNVIQTRPFQRLRRVKQLGFTDLVYPGASHSRFAHSVGVFHTARRLMEIIRISLTENRFEESRARWALAAALVHDLGHGPFSHAFEDFGRRMKLRLANHETVSDMLIRNGEVAEVLNTLGSGFAEDVANVIKGVGGSNIYSAVVSSQFDADRLDYMRRDRLMCGTDHGAIDFEWLLANIEVGEVPYGVDDQKLGSLETFVLGPKAIYAAESYVLGLFQLYPTVYFHKATRGSEKLFSELLVRIFETVRDGSTKATGLSKRHPLVRFAKEPDEIENILALDDAIIWAALTQMSDAKDKVVRELAHRIRDRKLYKSINLREWVSREFQTRHKRQNPGVVDLVCETIGANLKEWANVDKSEMPRILIDQAEREPYKRFQESKGPLNQIRIKTENGDLIDLGERSKVVGAIETFKLYRIYVRNEDDESQDFIEKLIKEEVGNASKSEREA